MYVSCEHWVIVWLAADVCQPCIQCIMCVWLLYTLGFVVVIVTSILLSTYDGDCMCRSFCVLLFRWVCDEIVDVLFMLNKGAAMVDGKIGNMIAIIMDGIAMMVFMYASWSEPEVIPLTVALWVSSKETSVRSRATRQHFFFWHQCTVVFVNLCEKWAHQIRAALLGNISQIALFGNC